MRTQIVSNIIHLRNTKVKRKIDLVIFKGQGVISANLRGIARRFTLTSYRR